MDSKDLIAISSVFPSNHRHICDKTLKQLEVHSNSADEMSQIISSRLQEYSTISNTHLLIDFCLNLTPTQCRSSLHNAEQKQCERKTDVKCENANDSTSEGVQTRPSP